MQLFAVKKLHAHLKNVKNQARSVSSFNLIFYIEPFVINLETRGLCEGCEWGGV